MELFKVYVNVLETKEVVSKAATIRMILFDGYCKGEYFNGEIQESAVDTQVTAQDGKTKLSARYILKGEDNQNNPCQVFIENNAEITEGIIYTQPKIYTDSKSLEWIEDINWRGRIENIGDQLVIIIEQ